MHFFVIEFHKNGLYRCFWRCRRRVPPSRFSPTNDWVAVTTLLALKPNISGLAYFFIYFPIWSPENFFSCYNCLEVKLTMECWTNMLVPQVGQTCLTNERIDCCRIYSYAEIGVECWSNKFVPTCWSRIEFWRWSKFCNNRFVRLPSMLVQVGTTCSPNLL